MNPNQKPGVSPFTDYLFSKAGRLFLPLSGTFELTPTCNFTCKMCYVRKSPAEVAASPRPSMTMEGWQQLAKEACSKGMLYLLLTGGEPTLWPGFWELYEELHRMGLLLSVNTNGSTLDDKAIQRLADSAPRRINITLYGGSEDTYRRLCQAQGMYDRVVHNIDALREAGLMLKLNCSLTPDNAGDLETMVRFAEDRELILDITPYMFPPLRRDPSAIGRNQRFTPREAAYYRLEAYRLQQGRERWLSYLRSIAEGSIPPPGLDEGCIDPLDGQIRCRAGKACFWVTWDGWLMPCGMMTEPRLDLQQGSFDSLWPELNRLSCELKLSGLCQSCANNRLCHACAAMAQTETGSASGIPLYLCETAKELKALADSYLARE